MDENKTAVNTTDSAASQEDIEKRLASLEAEKAKYVEEAANWKLAALKAKSKAKETGEESSQEEYIRSLAREELVNATISAVDFEHKALLNKTLKENKELRLAYGNKLGPAGSISASTEAPGVRDTLVTPEQEAYFRNTLKWNDKKITDYKKKLTKYGTR